MKLHQYLSILRVFLASFALLLSLACGGASNPKQDAEAQEAKLGDQSHADSAVEPVATFEPALLLSSKETAQFAVEIPDKQKDKDGTDSIRVLLNDRAPYVLMLRIVAECATKRSQKELQSKIPEMKAAIVDHISGKTPKFVNSTEGRMKLKEEILQVMQRQMENKAIKRIYFTEYYMAPGKI